MRIVQPPRSVPAVRSNILTWATQAQQTLRDLCTAIAEINPRRVASGSSAKLIAPWDIIQRVGVGMPDEAGKYSSYKCKFYPGTIGGIMPANIFDEIMVSGTGTQYLAGETTTADGSVQTVTLAMSASHPATQEQTLGGPPGSLDILLGVFVDGAYWNVAKANLTLTAVESLRESDPTPAPYGLPYRSYYVWRVD